MQNFQDISETRKQSFVSTFSICMTAPLIFCCDKFLYFAEILMFVNGFFFSLFKFFRLSKL